jgi:molybdate transport system ATP-binding protein
MLPDGSMTLEARVALTVGTFQLQVELQAVEGEVVVILGPNGSGKTTLLRALAGLTRLRAGRVVLDQQVLEDTERRLWVPPERRPVGVVFQDYLLFPHLNVLDNVAFGLVARGMSRRKAQAEALTWLARMDLASWAAQAKPSTLSGGQAQRVALARALVTSPRLLLLDEPLAALDASIRSSVRRELRRHLVAFPGVRLVVTHDPLEAIALADRLVVVEGGRVVQAGIPAEVTSRPRSRYVADLVGVNLLRGRVQDGALGLHGGGRLFIADPPAGEVFAVIHPRSVSLWREQPHGTPRNVWRGMAAGLELLGDRVRVRVEGEPPIVAEVTPSAVAALHLDEGGEVWVSVKATEIQTYPSS